MFRSNSHQPGGSTWCPPIAVLLLFLVLVAGAAFGQSHVLTLNPEETDVAFELGATGHDVHGIFSMTRGQIRFDPATGRASGEIEIDALSGESGSAQRDKKMHKKVLESSSFRTITFRPDHIEGTVALDGPSDFALVGEMTLLGEVHPVTLPVHAEIRGGAVTASSSFDVPYIEWGLHNPSLLMLRVAKEVGISIEARGDLADSTDTPSSDD